jgi:hypothetical protein
MNFLFMFDDFVDLVALIQFENFIEELEVGAYTEAANTGLSDSDPKFPANYMVVFANTQDKDLLETITNKYNRLCIESPAILDKHKQSQSQQANLQ